MHQSRKVSSQQFFRLPTVCLTLILSLSFLHCQEAVGDGTVGFKTQLLIEGMPAPSLKSNQFVVNRGEVPSGSLAVLPPEKGMLCTACYCGELGNSATSCESPQKCTPPLPALRFQVLDFDSVAPDPLPKEALGFVYSFAVLKDEGSLLWQNHTAVSMGCFASGVHLPVFRERCSRSGEKFNLLGFGKGEEEFPKFYSEVTSHPDSDAEGQNESSQGGIDGALEESWTRGERSDPKASFVNIPKQQMSVASNWNMLSGLDKVWNATYAVGDLSKYNESSSSFRFCGGSFLGRRGPILDRFLKVSVRVCRSAMIISDVDLLNVEACTATKSFKGVAWGETFTLSDLPPFPSPVGDNPVHLTLNVRAQKKSNEVLWSAVGVDSDQMSFCGGGKGKEEERSGTVKLPEWAPDVEAEEMTILQ
uniref:Uncharacterized protein n=1 Tax=Chromera velia CCMP2878 TaxID=1169474 RepID=A0A0G4GLU0_9ALVE|eukprot:Cvel_4893.t1-p1 / transcript=Cvel_4893.t1 / gene=Cvel_4893 / organism=Chromera_velia_CCMP2878 / gene_product=hypothetical protein / transcript_product=hypothetical protein / location=Cvel_scaffold220:101965-103218(+) / protein_length=418 / sequence_SO=supercontig / SO=protein_coding / is_pseudo=false